MKWRAPAEFGSLLMAGVVGRVAGALGLIAVLWLAVRWASTSTVA